MYTSRGLAGTSRWRHLTADDLEVKGLPLQDLALSASASDLRFGVVSVNLLPPIPTSKLIGDFAGGTFGMNIIPKSNQHFDIGTSTANWRDAYPTSIKIASNGSLTSQRGDFSIVATSNHQSLTFSESDRKVSLSNADLTLTGSIQASGATLTAPLSMSSNSIEMTGTIALSDARLSDIFTDNAHINDLLVESSAAFSTTILPTSNGMYDVGSSGEGWRNIYADTLILTGSLSVAGVSVSGNLDVESNALLTSGDIGSSSNRAAGVYERLNDVDYQLVNSNLTLASGATTSFGTDLIPSSNAQYNLGATNKTWNNVYAMNGSFDGHLSIGGSVTLASNLSAGGISSSKGLTSVGTALFNSNVTVFGPIVLVAGMTSSNGLVVAAGTTDLKSNLTVSGPIASSNTLTVSGNTTLGSNLGVAGSITAANGLFSSHGLNVTGTSSFSSNVVVSGNIVSVGGLISSNGLVVASGTASLGINLTVIGPISSSNTLTIARITTLSSNLGVYGTTNLGSNLTVIGPIASSNTLVVAGNTTLNSNQGVSGTTSLGSNLTIVGPIASSNTLVVAGNTTLNSNLVVSGTTSLGSNLIIIGPIASSNALVVGGNTTLNSNLGVSETVTAAGGFFSSNGLNVTGTSSFSSNVSVSGSLVSVGGLTSSNGLVVASGTASLGSNLTVIGMISSSNTLTIAGSTTMNSNLGFSGPTSLGSNLTVTGPIASSNTLTVAGNTTLNSVIGVSGTTSLGSNLTVSGPIASSNTLSVAGVTTLGSNLSVLGSVTAAGLFSSNGLNVAGTSSFSSNVSVSGNILALGGLTSSNGLVVAFGTTSLGSTLIVTGPIASSHTLVVAGITTLNSNLGVSGSITAIGGIFPSNGLNVSGTSSFSSNVSVTWNIVALGGLTSSNGLLIASGHGQFLESISAVGATLSAPLVLGSNLLSTTGDISSGSNRAASVYSTTVNANVLTVNSNLSIAPGGITNIGTDLKPSSNSTYDIGTGSNKWKSIYASNINLTGTLAANGVTVNGDINLGTNKLYSTGDIRTSNSRIANAYLSVVDASYVTIGNANIDGSLQCQAINTRNSNIVLGLGSISTNSLTASNGISGGAITGTSLSTTGGSLTAGAISGTGLSVGTGANSAGTGNFSGSMTVNGDLQVGGVLNYINSTSLQVQDKNITLAISSNATDALAIGAGFFVQGAGYSTSNSTISLTWNTGSNGNYWLSKGGNISLLGVSGSTKMVSLVAASDGSFKIMSDDGVTVPTTALLGTSLLASSSNLDVGSTSNGWGTLFATNVGTSNKPVSTIFAASLSSGAVSCGAITTNNSNLTCGTESITGGVISGSSGSFSGGVTSSNGLSVTSRTSTFAGAIIASNGLTVAAPSTFGSNLTVLGAITCPTIFQASLGSQVGGPEING
jgi:hypothetical protein